MTATARTATSSSSTPALPPAARDRAGGGDHLALGALLFGGLLAAYLLTRASTSPWPPKGVDLQLYVPVIIAITLLMSSFTAEWACDAHRRGDRRSLLLALGMTTGFGLAYLNGQWFELGRLHLAAGRSAYHTLFLSLVGFHMAHVAVVALATVLGVVRVLGGLPARSGLVRALAILWHLGVATWLLVFWLLYLVK